VYDENFILTISLFCSFFRQTSRNIPIVFYCSCVFNRGCSALYSLPAPPEPTSRVVTAKGVLDAACGKLPPRIENALNNVPEAAEKGKQLQTTRKPLW